MRFRVIIADPPWSFGDKLRMSSTPRGAEANYATMPTTDVMELAVGPLMEPDSVGAVWVPDALLQDGLSVLKAWGFEHRQVWTWVKTAKGEERLDPDGVPDDLAMAFGMGRLARACCEHLLVGVRGRPYPHLRDRSTRNVFLHAALPHSQKPETVQDALERMFPEGPHLELFARRQRPGWVCVGNEAPASRGFDIRINLNHLKGES